MRAGLTAGGTFALALLAAAAFADPPPAPAPPPKLADDAGRDRTIAVCGGCHDPKMVIGQHHDEPGWADVMNRMVDHGAQITDADFAVIAAYLSKHY